MGAGTEILVTGGLGYIGSHSYHQILSADLNEPAYVIRPDGTVYYPTTTKANPAPFALHTLVPVGIQPNQIAVKSFVAQVPSP